MLKNVRLHTLEVTQNWNWGRRLFFRFIAVEKLWGSFEIFAKSSSIYANSWFQQTGHNFSLILLSSDARFLYYFNHCSLILSCSITISNHSHSCLQRSPVRQVFSARENYQCNWRNYIRKSWKHLLDNCTCIHPACSFQCTLIRSYLK